MPSTLSEFLERAEKEMHSDHKINELKGGEGRNYQKANKIWQKMLFKEFIKDEFPSESDLESGSHRKLIKDFWDGIRKADLALSELARKF